MTSKFEQVLNSPMLGYACHRIVLDDLGRPCDYEFLEVNESFAKLTGLKKKQIIGRTVRQVIPGFERAEFDWIGCYGAVALGGGDKEFEQYSEPLKRWYRVHVSSPERLFFTTLFIDINESKKKTEELEGFFTINLDLLCIADLEGRFIKTNEAWTRVLGYSTRELNQRKFLEFVHPDDLQETVKAMTDLGKGQEVLGFTNRYRCRDGSYRYIEWRSRPKGELIYAAARDITERKLAEAALRESELFMRETQAIAKLGGWKTNPRTDTLVWNDGVYDIIEESTDYRPGLAEGIKYYDSAYIPALRKGLENCLASGNPFTLEAEITTAKGKHRWVEVRAFARTDSGGEPMVMGTIQDITERKKTEEKLLHSERTYREIFDSITDALFIHDINTGAILDVNDTMLAMFGYTRQEMHGVTVADLSGLVEPYTNEHAGELIKRAAAGETVVFQWLNRRKNGELFYSENILKFVTIAGAQRIMAIVRDITERKQAEEALHESEAKLSALFDAMTEMVVLHQVIFDQAGTPVNYRITDCNKAYTCITGISRDNAVGKLANEVYGTSEPPYLEEFTRVGISGEPYHYETYFPPMDKHFSISVVSPGKNQFATITTDITEIKRIQAVIAAKNKELEQLVYVASHDLRSPLVNVDGFSRELDFSLKELVTLLEDGRDQAQLVKQLQVELPGMEKNIGRIRASARQMDELLNGLLKLSRSGRSALQIRNIDMNDLVAGLGSSFSFRLQETGIELEVDSLPACRGDAVQLTQVFSNLLDNAVKFSDPGRPGRIRIRGAMESGRAVYRVEDNGIGIAENHLERVFELFHRLDPGKTAGEGLGLTIARQALGRMDGEIVVESKPGQGSVFMVILPPARKGDKQ